MTKTLDKELIRAEEAHVLAQREPFREGLASQLSGLDGKIRAACSRGARQIEVSVPDVYKEDVLHKLACAGYTVYDAKNGSGGWRLSW